MKLRTYCIEINVVFDRNSLLFTQFLKSLLMLWPELKVTWSQLKHFWDFTQKITICIRSKIYICRKSKSLYYSLIHSHLTYGTLLWASSYQYRLHKLELLKMKSIRNICNDGYYPPTTPFVKQLDITKLMDIYNIQYSKLMCQDKTNLLNKWSCTLSSK